MSTTIYAEPTMQMRKVVLHGRLKRILGQDEFRMMASSPKDAISCLCSQVSGFQKLLSEGWYRCVLASPKRQTAIAGQADVTKPWQAIGDDAVFHIVPVTKGRGGRGGSAMKIVMGVVLIAASIATAGVASAGFAGGLGAGMGATVPGAVTSAMGISFAQIAGLGAMMALGGISQLLSPQVKAPPASDRESPEQRASFMFHQAVNVADQGGAIPLIYGDCLVGSQVISAGMHPYDFSATGGASPVPGGAGLGEGILGAGWWRT